MVSVGSLCTRFLYLRSITQRQTTNQISALENRTQPLPAALPAHTNLTWAPTTCFLRNLQHTFSITSPMLLCYTHAPFHSSRYGPFTAKRFTHLNNQKRKRSFLHYILQWNKTPNSESLLSQNYKLLQEEIHCTAPGFLSHYLLPCTSIPLFLLHLLSSGVARQLGVYQGSCHPALWDSGQAVGKKRTMSKFNEMRSELVNSWKQTWQILKLGLIISCTLLSSTIVSITASTSYYLFESLSEM